MEPRLAPRAIAAALSALALCLAILTGSVPMAQAEQEQGVSTPVPVSVSTGRASLTLERNAIGNVPDPRNVKLTLSMAARPGDTVVVTIPESISNGNGVYRIGDAQEIPSSIGTVTRKDDQEHHCVTFTYQFTKSASLTNAILLEARNNYWGQPSPIDGVGTSTKTITWSVNGQEADPIDFTQVIAPAMHPTAVTRVNPSSSEYPAIYTHQNYTYRFAVNEVDGVYDSTSCPSAQVNSAVNFGTTIRVPVPPHFQLDQAATDAMNAFKDQTSISQPDGVSGDLVITVPQGSGRQCWQSAPPYYFVGSYQVDQPVETQTLVAPGEATIDQTIVDPQGVKRHLTATVPTWSETLRPAGQSQPCPDGNKCLSVSIGGNNTVNDLLLTNNSKLTTLNFMGFGNESPRDFTDAVLEIDIPSGFDATGVVTPVSASQLPGLTSYRYEVTQRDGTVSTGTVKAGGTITRTGTSPMRKVRLWPDRIAAGAHTDKGASCTTLVDDNAQCAGHVQLYLQGTLARDYDDGTPVASGDMFTTSFTMSVPNATWDAEHHAWKAVSLTTSVKQQVITRADLEASLSVWSNQSRTLPGSTPSGWISVFSAANAGNPTTDLVYEPVFYYVLPQGTSYDRRIGVSTLNSHDGITAKPTVSQFQAQDGRQVVKIDYTGTGYWFSTPQAANTSIHLDINADAQAGSYPWEIYMVSPRTRMTTANPAAGKAAAPYLQGRTTNVYRVGGGTWTIAAPNAVMTSASSQGNQAYAFAPQTNSDDTHAGNGERLYEDDPRVMRFAVTVTNGSAETLHDVRQFVNIPQQGGANGFSVHLTGPVTWVAPPGGGTDAPAYTVRYSTHAATLDESVDATPSTDGYVEADQVSDWSAIRSVLITMDTLGASASAGRFVLPGLDPTLVNDAGKSVFLETALYARTSDGSAMVPLVTRASDADAASISVAGHSTIRARLHWVDQAGKDQYVDLDDLTRTYADNVDEFRRDDYPTGAADFSEQDRARFPEGYTLDENATTIKGDLNATYPIGGVPGTAQWNTTVRYNYNGSIVQYELVRKPVLSTMPVTGITTFWNTVNIAILTLLMAVFAGGMLLRRGRSSHKK